MSVDSGFVYTNYILSVIIAIGGFITVAVGLFSYRISQQQKKKEFTKEIVYPLMDEFDRSNEIDIARRLLEDKTVVLPENFKPKYLATGYVEYDPDDLRHTLRHLGKGEKVGEVDYYVRKCFDKYLNFLCKLEYLYGIGMIGEKELEYYRDYIE